MKPEPKHCLNCGEEVSGKRKYCDDACRMAYARKPNKQPEQITNPNTNKQPKTQPEHSNPNKLSPNLQELRDSLTVTDKTFFDRAMCDFEKPYYRFGEVDKSDTCLAGGCGKKFKTSLKLLKYCSYECYSRELQAR